MEYLSTYLLDLPKHKPRGPNQNLKWLEMKTTSNRRRPQIIRRGISQHHSSDFSPLLNLRLGYKTKVENCW